MSKYSEIVEAVGEQEAERLIVCDMGSIEAVHAHLTAIGSIDPDQAWLDARDAEFDDRWNNR